MGIKIHLRLIEQTQPGLGNGSFVIIKSIKI